MDDSLQKIKVLYVGFTEIGDNDATGNTLSSIFDGWNDVDVIQYSLDYSSCNHVGRGKVIYTDKLLSLGYYLVKSFYRKFGSTNRMAVIDHNTSFQSKGSLGKAVLDLLPKCISQRGSNAIKEFHPDFVYTLAENISTLRISIAMAKKYGIPVVIHVMDDYEETIYTSGLCHRFFRKQYIRYLSKLYDHVRFGIAISEKMKNEYQRRHNKPFITAMNCVGERPLQVYQPNEPLRMIFSGGLHGGRAQSIAAIGKVIQECDDLKQRVQLEVFTSNACYKQYKDLLSNAAIVKEYVPRDRYFENLSKADILLHVESFDKNEINYFRYSMSTKIPEYLSVGRAVFCYGPMEICTVEFLQESGAGMVASSQKELEKCLLELSSDNLLREAYANRAYEKSKIFTKENVRSVLLGQLQQWKE